MKAFMKTKAGVVLVGFSVLAVWMLLAAQPAQAHTNVTPTCSGLPTAENFFADANTAPIAPDDGDHAPTPKQGEGTADKAGNPSFQYAKITVPQLAAGELRVFDNRTGGANASAAVLCLEGREHAKYIASHPSSHTSAERAYTAASTAQMVATDAASADPSNTITEPQARTALRNAASALRSAASALRSAATALTNADLTTEAGNATTAADNAYTTVTTDTDHATDATEDAGDSAKDLAALKADLGTAAGHLGTAAGVLRSSANALHNTEATSTVFQLRAEVLPGDQEYILVATGTPTLAVQFYGAIAASDVQRERTLNPGDQHTYSITVTAPGLLTVETTGSTDTAGMFDSTMDAMDDNSGSGGNNFRIVVPVTQNTTAYTLTVDGQTPTTTGAYTLDMDFKVAMQDKATNNIEGVDPTPITLPTGVMIPTAPTWTNTDVDADDEVLQIEKIAEDGNRADEDYFLITIDANSSGFLTVETTDDTTSADDSNTEGTFYGPTGEITSDTSSGTGNHFKIRTPVEEGQAYLVKVEGTDGVYLLNIKLDQAEGDDLLTVPGAQNGPSSADCSDETAGEICAPTSGNPLGIERYVFDVTESGALDVRTTGTIDTVGTLYGPSGNQIATDDNSGTNNNFRISASVGPGLHLVEVRGKERTTQGVFNLIVNFVPGAEPIDPTDPVDPVDPGPPTVRTDSTGELEDPPNGGTRSGIGLIRGWVCGATRVEVRITGPSGPNSRNYEIPVLYGSDRGDVADLDVCDSRGDDFGFAAQFNYNELPTGTYTAQAFADGEQIGQVDNGQTNTFQIIRLSDTDPFLERLSREVTVEGFPFRGDTTVLEWDQASQNFQIKNKTP